MAIRILSGDALDRLKDIPDETYSGVITDPPYGLSGNPNMEEVLTHWLRGDDYIANGSGFKGETWDSFVPGPAVWKELYRASKPGAILLAYCGTRTADLMGVSIRLGGWQKRDEIEVIGPIDQFSWIYSTAMPKSLDLAKHADRIRGLEGDVVDRYDVPDTRNGHGRAYGGSVFAREDTGNLEHIKRAPVSEDAKNWFGYGTNLNPAHEIIMLFRKQSPFDFYETAVRYGTGVLNIDKSRVPTFGKDKKTHLGEWDRMQSEQASKSVVMEWDLKAIDLRNYQKDGRWPKNTLFFCCEGEYEDCDCPINQLDTQTEHSKSKRAQRGAGINGNLFKSPEYESTERGFNDEGSKARFFYINKASRAERDAGLSSPNLHPAMKPIGLTKYIADMILPPPPYREEAVLAVPFSGVGSEMIGALLSGWNNIDGFEQSDEYIAIAQERYRWWTYKAEQFQTTDVSEILKLAKKGL